MSKLNVVTLYQRMMNNFRKNGIEYLYCLMWGLVIEIAYLILEIRNMLFGNLERWEKAVEQLSSHMYNLYSKQASIVILLLLIVFSLLIMLAVISQKLWIIVEIFLFLVIIPLGLIKFLSPLGVLISLFIFTRLVYLFRKICVNK